MGKALRQRVKKRTVVPALRTEEEVREGLKVVRMSLVNVREKLREADGGTVDFTHVAQEIQLVEQYRTLRWFLREDVSVLELEEEGGREA